MREEPAEYRMALDGGEFTPGDNRVLTAPENLLNELEKALRRLEDPRVILPIVDVLTDHVRLPLGICLECETDWPCKPILDLAMRLKITPLEDACLDSSPSPTPTLPSGLTTPG